jgi:hypothetical protein
VERGKDDRRHGGRGEVEDWGIRTGPMGPRGGAARRGPRAG